MLPKRSILFFSLMLLGTISVMALPSSIYRKALDKYPDQLDSLIEDLRDDDVRWNAIAAIEAIRYYASDEFKRNPNLISALEEALDSEDWQQRQMAAYLLRTTIKDYEPTPRLLEVTVEGLRDDHLPREYEIEDGKYRTKRCVFLFNAAEGVRYLLENENMGTEALEAALDSDDAQQRFLAAYVLGATGRKNKLERIAEILLPHLEHDNIPRNACLATYALYHLGDEVIPILKEYEEAEDKQKREAIQLILYDLNSPPKTREQRLHRAEMHSLSYVFADPCVHMKFFIVGMGKHRKGWRERFGDNVGLK